jgi:hypothetical protein
MPLADVMSEIVDVLVATKKHEILILTRKVRDAHLRWSIDHATPTSGDHEL